MNRQYETINVSDYNGISVISFEAPYSNRMSTQFLDDLSDAADACINEQPKGIILTGSGRHFSVGADVDQLQQSVINNTLLDKEGNISVIPERQIRTKKILMRLSDASFPVAAAIRGFCIGSGAELAYFCHFRICEKSMKIGSPESTFGIMPGLGGCVNTCLISGLQESLDMVLTGNLLSFDEAKKNNIVDISAPKNKSLDTAIELIEFINNSAEYVRSRKTFILEEFSRR